MLLKHAVSMGHGNMAKPRFAMLAWQLFPPPSSTWQNNVLPCCHDAYLLSPQQHGTIAIRHVAVAMCTHCSVSGDTQKLRAVWLINTSILPILQSSNHPVILAWDGGMRVAIESAAPLRGVLDDAQYSCINSCINSCITFIA